MSDHLPECIYTPERFDPEQNIVWDGKPCICDRLRACEQRVREDMALQYLVSDREQQEQEERAFAAGVEAARDAVDAVPPIDQRVDDNGLISLVYEKGEILAAIDALRSEP